MAKEQHPGNKGRNQLSVDSATYRLLRLVAQRNCRSISKQIKFYVEQDIQRGQVHDQQETIQATK